MLRAIWRILLFAVVLSATAGVATLIAGALVGAAGLGTLEYQTVGSIVQAAAALVTTWLLLRFVDHGSWKDVGLHRAAADPGRLVGGFLIGGSVIAVAILALIAVGWLRVEHVPSLSSGHPIARVTLLLIPAALAEEVITRGYLLSVLRDAVNWPV